jgi:hypothetical protein
MIFIVKIWAEDWFSFELEHLRFAFNLTASFESYNKLGALAYSTLNSDRAGHLLNQTLAYAKTESDSKFISLRIGFNLAKVNEEIFKPVRGNSTTEVLNF